MNYIRSRDIYYLIRDILELIDKRPTRHGMRTAYFFCKMLRDQGKMEEFEVADMALLATFHDIGAYRSDNLNDLLRMEIKNYLPHSIYGYLFFRYLSPRPDLSQIILYHHMDYNKLSGIDFKERELASLLNIAEKVDIYSHTLGEQFDLKMLTAQADKKLSGKGLALFAKVNGEENLIGKVKSGDYKQELDEIADYLIFPNENKRKYMDMLLYCEGFRGRKFVVDTITCIGIAEELGRRAALSEEEQDILYYGALLHDIGMMAVPRQIVEAPRTLTRGEKNLVIQHVNAAKRLLDGRIKPEIMELIEAHHERENGSGYPGRRRSEQMNRLQKILQVADMVTGMTSGRSYRPPLPKEKVVATLRQEAASGKLNKQITDILIVSYDEVMGRVEKETADILQLYNRLNVRYEQLADKFRTETPDKAPKAGVENKAED